MVGKDLSRNTGKSGVREVKVECGWVEDTHRILESYNVDSQINEE